MSYISIQQVRDAGLTDATRYPDATVQAAIDLWSKFVDTATRQWFEERAGTVLVDGNDSEVLFLPVPIISVTQLFANSKFDPALDLIDPQDYVVYNGRDNPDDRKNPKIAFVNRRRSIYQLPNLTLMGRIFMKGRQNQKIVGSFGYTEADGSVPVLIQRAVLKLVLRNIDPLVNNLNANRVVAAESTDGHSVQYMSLNQIVKGRTLAITGDPEVETILNMYRSPIVLKAPGSANPLAYFEMA